MSKYTELRDWYVPTHALSFNDYRTTKAITWEIGFKGSGLVFEVGPGLAFDVSVPWLLTWLINPNDPRFMKAAALHDYMLEHDWDRPTAGAIFHDALKADGVGKIKRLAMFIAVSVFKWS